MYNGVMVKNHNGITAYGPEEKTTMPNLNDAECPNCHADNVYGVNLDINGDGLVNQNMCCGECEHEYVNSYTLTSQESSN